MGDETEPYTGPERRIEQRRRTVDRRELVRFEPGKEDRRKLPDRRKTKTDTWDQRDI